MDAIKLIESRLATSKELEGAAWRAYLREHTDVWKMILSSHMWAAFTYETLLRDLRGGHAQA